MSAPAAPQFVVTDDELQLIGSRTGVTEFPVVLAIRPRHGTTDQLERARTGARRCLAERGLIAADDTVYPALADALHTLRRPRRELAVRLVTPDGTARISVARSGDSCVSARRVRNELHLRMIDAATDPAAMTRAVLAELPAADPAQFDPFGAPVTELAHCLDGTHDARELIDRLRTVGASHRSAMALGAAFASRVAFAEIVCHVLDPVADRVVRTAGAVAVLYTKRGRLVSAPSMSPSGQLWATLKPGTNHRLTQAVSQLIELAPGGWEGVNQ